MAAWTKKHQKHWQAAHLAYHTVDRAIHAHAELRLEKQRQHERSALPKVTGLGALARALKPRPSDDGKDPLTLQVAVASKLKLTNFLTLLAPDKKVLEVQLPGPELAEARPDSDDDGESPSTDMSQDNLSCRHACLSSVLVQP